jgi:hypothetical protein
MTGMLLLLCSLGQVPGADGPLVVEQTPALRTSLFGLRWAFPEVPIGTLWARDGSSGGIPYTPQEGDIILLGSVSPEYSIFFPLACSWHPWHSGLVVRRVTGDLAFFEAGGDIHPYVSFRTPTERLQNWMTKTELRPRAWIRRIKQPLTVEESRELTTFAETQGYKPFVNKNSLFLFVVPGRPLPKTSPDNDRWFCSGMILEALVVAGLMTPRELPRPEALTPFDLLNDRGIDLNRRWAAPLVFSATDQPPPPGPPLAPP